MSYRTLNHEKFKINYHIIFSTKYRRKCLYPILNDIKKYMKLAESRQSDWLIEIMDIDKEKPDHIHFLISATPNSTISKIVHSLKQISTYYCWKEHYDYMTQFYWKKEHHLWTRGYFVCSLGDISEKVIKNYIEKQG